jgi:hypothetical protein
MIEKFREADVVEPVMTRRAGKEAEMKGLSGFSQALAGNAFKWASRGILESDWLDRVFEKYPHSPHESWMREAYERRIDVLRSEGPWPWPRD